MDTFMNKLKLGNSALAHPAPDSAGILATWATCAENHTAAECPVANVLDLIAYKWTLHIIHALHKNEVVRFREIQRLVAPVTQKELTKRLRQLENAGLISRRVYAEVPPRVEYRLTEMGLSLIPPLAALTVWAKQYLEANEKL